ncbi:unnamed protein product [Candidula unifasciata]|uniref:PH domain-containing protein n=1 Tax=Candidula unifasciata TaxID=100452 RepID=A0A8S3YGD9_9EUPU|nr:unnamed protein product [Candidula unifasciata]
MGDIVKSGYVKRYSKKFLSGGWNQSFLELHRDSQLNVYKKQGDSKCQGSIFLKDVAKYFAYGQYTEGMPDRPSLPSGASYDCIMGIPQKPSSKAKIHWFLFSSVNELNDWMTAICSTLPPPPQRDNVQQQQASPVSSAPLVSSAPPANYGPPSPGPGLGFENLTCGAAPPPYSAAPNQYRPPSPYPQGPHYSPQHQPYAPPPGTYGPPPGTYGPPPQAAYPRPAYYPAPAQGYPQQQYPQQQYYQQQPAGGYQGYPQQQYVQQQPVVYKQKSKGILGSKAGKLAAGLAGGALLGYGASRMLGGGWGVGRWGSWSSLSSCGSFGSVGSFGSFGSFD